MKKFLKTFFLSEEDNRNIGHSSLLLFQSMKSSFANIKHIFDRIHILFENKVSFGDLSLSFWKINRRFIEKYSLKNRAERSCYILTITTLVLHFCWLIYYIYNKRKNGLTGLKYKFTDNSFFIKYDKSNLINNLIKNSFTIEKIILIIHPKSYFTYNLHF